MPRKQFIADVQIAAESNILGITAVARGDDDGEVIVTYSPPTGAPIEISLLHIDVSSYPSDGLYMSYAKSEIVPVQVGDILAEVGDFSSSMRLPELISIISQKLRRALTTGSQSAPFSIDDNSDVEMMDGDEVEEEFEEDEEEYYPEDDDFGDSADNGESSHARQLANYHLSPEAAKALNRRIARDLRAAKLAGFTVGVLSGMKADSMNNLISIAMRVARLGLSEEALQAWDLEPHQYIVLLVRYVGSYAPFEDIMCMPAKSHDISFRIGLCNRYKPSNLEAHAAFTDAFKGNDNTSDGIDDAGDDKARAGFTNLFISSSLNEFINSQFISLLKIRHSMALGWDGAKLFFNDKQGYLDTQNDGVNDKLNDDPSGANDNLPDPIAADHLTNPNVVRHSFPLIAAQFAFRYLVRCTDFCLVCHDKIAEEFEALKPYVCSKPLCLYQYMSLGFGPSVEHEILTQPYVVDLLVSFCYASARNRSLREYPTGMSLSVPPVIQAQTAAYPTRAPATQVMAMQPASRATTPTELQVDVKYDNTRHEVTFDPTPLGCPVRNGDWVVVAGSDQIPKHYRVQDISLYPVVKLSDTPPTFASPEVLAAPKSGAATFAIPVTPAMTPPPALLSPAKLVLYNQNFDDMENVEKAETIVSLLDTLPTIKDLQAFLIQQSRSSEPSLRAWKDRVSPAALGLLRWIIASNRSCIVQVDKCPGQDDDEVAKAKVPLDQRVSNISETFVQFRFAQGSPDKEQRFLNALKSQQESLNSKFPTIFAWHGSPLSNWHSIIRSGLDFKEIAHGRAFGHGVYHAMDQATSIGYAQPNSSTWRGSKLNIISAMSLNEIVNCPSKFASSKPYLVVQHIDWIQCRYLFVQVRSNSDSYDNLKNNSSQTTVDSAGRSEVQQDSNYVARSTLNKSIGVPTCAVSVSRAFRSKGKPEEVPHHKKRKTKLIMSEASVISEGESLSDIEALISDDEDEVIPVRGKPKSTGNVVKRFLGSLIKQENKEREEGDTKLQKPLTDFVPNTLDPASLPMLEPPDYATPSATKTLQRNLKEVLEVQKSKPLHELGWYINPELISNMYQWIIELHSFESHLPLAKDMKAAGITSIVLEIRFGKDYPFSPPFLRIIRPRFLPFALGGGGHVTAGGAMCMELLTNTGWMSTSTIESVLLQVRLALMSTDPKPARLESKSPGGTRDYGTGEAIEAFIRACQMHGWEVPAEFRNTFQQPAASGPLPGMF